MSSTLSTAAFVQQAPPNIAPLIAIWVFVAFIILIEFTIIGVMIAGMWKVFEKAGKPGWAAIVPFYNFVVMLEIVGRPTWWLALMFVPIASMIVAIIVTVELANAFGKSGGFCVGMIFLPFIFFPILGFGSSQYLGPRVQPQPQYGFPVGPPPQ